MLLQEFREQLKKVYALSKMNADVSWPFVYNEYEKGDIFVDEDGNFYFADKNSNWLESPFRLSGIVNLRCKKWYKEGGIDIDGEEPSESDIWIHFHSGEHIWINSGNESGIFQIFVSVHKNEENSRIVEGLKRCCERPGSLSISVQEFSVKDMNFLAP